MLSGGHNADNNAESVGEQWRNWFLLNGHRLHVMALTAVAIFAFLAAVSVSGIAPYRDLQPLYYAFSALLSGNLTVITVVVAINQLLLSRAFHTPSEIKSQIQGVIDYRQDIEDIAGRIAPVEPLGFLRLLVENTRREAQTLGGLTISENSEEVHEEVDSIVSDVTAQADRVDDLLQESNASTFDVLSATLTTNYARPVNELRRIKSDYGDQLSGHVEESIESLIHDLEDIDVARQYFKTIYLQEELATVSRLLFYVGLVSLASVVSGLLLLTASKGVSVPRPYLSVVVPALITVGFLPIALLFAFILRIATVTQQTAAILPFTTPVQER